MDDLAVSSVRNAHKKIRGSSDAQSVNLKNRLLRETPFQPTRDSPAAPLLYELTVSWGSVRSIHARAPAT